MTRTSLFVSSALSLAVLSGVLGGCSETPYPQGKLIYEYKCGNCHMNDGSGLVGNIPPLAQADWLVEHREDIACVIRYGQQGPIEVNELPYNGIMQGFPELSNTELTNVANYILSAWGNNLPPLKASRIGDMLEDCELEKPITVGNPQQLPMVPE